MILGGLWRKLKFLIILVIIIAVVLLLIKIFKIRSEVEKMIRDEAGLLSLLSKSDDSVSPEEMNWKSFLFPTLAYLKPSIYPDFKTEARRVKTKPTSNTNPPSHAKATSHQNTNHTSPKIPKQDSSQSYESDFNGIFEESEEENEKLEDQKRKEDRQKPRRSGSKTSNYKREEMCRAIFEEYFDDYFPTCRPNFLINPLTGRNLELDGYNPSKNIGWEYQGLQHRVYPNPFHKSEEEFKKQQARDQYKRERLSELGIDLIEISDEIPTSQIREFIHQSLKLLGHSPVKSGSNAV